MDLARNDKWGQTRQMFADQFNHDGSGFIYRRSQKGQAIRVSAAERDRFVEEFDDKLRRSIWLIYAGTILVLAASIALSLIDPSVPMQPVIYGGLALVMVPYLIYNRRAWAAPARALEGRVPIAGERSPEEVQRLKFQRITYRQLAIAALGGLVFPFVGAARADLFSGWNRLWLLFGGALVMFAAAQAFRKWRFEQEQTYTGAIRAPFGSAPARSPDNSAVQNRSQVWRYLIPAVIVAFVLLLLTPAGKPLVHSQYLMPVMMIGIGGYALFTVARGFTGGAIAPFVRGFSRSYERASEPKRFWASMAWNAMLGGLCLWVAFMAGGEMSAREVQDRCYNANRTYSAEQAVWACSQMIERRTSLRNWTMADAYLGRGLAYQRLKDPRHAIADYSRAIGLQPNDFGAWFDRGTAYAQLNQQRLAIADFSAAIRLKRDPQAYLDRGYLYGHVGDRQSAIDDFTQVINLTPDRALAYYFRALAYRDMGDTERATSDFGMAFRLDPRLCHGCRS